MIPVLLASLALAAAAPAQDAARPRDCLQIGAGADTHYYPVDDRTIVIEAQRRRWFKLIVSPTSLLNTPTSYLINDIRGTSTLCSPLDFDLSVAETSPGSFRQGIIVQSFEPITADEGVALRRRSRR